MRVEAAQGISSLKNGGEKKKGCLVFWFLDTHFVFPLFFSFYFQLYVSNLSLLVGRFFLYWTGMHGVKKKMRER